jgi:hypothetical protein
VGDYTLLTRLGEGGMGIVHLARSADGRRVALKVLRPHIVGDEEARARLAREVNTLTRVRSPWIAEFLDADPWADVPYVVTRYVPGLSLHDHVVEEGPVRDRDLLWLAGCLAEGVAAVHHAGVLHRDIKPSNVLMEGRTPILIDFGLARVTDDPRLTQAGWLLGTPGYLAPEILHGEDATTAADLHSWAATVAYAGTGRPPFGRGPSMAVMDRVRRGQHDLTGLPDDLRDVVAATLDPDPGRRPTLPELLEWLDDPRGPVPGPPEDDDPYTVPLALARRDRSSERTVTFFDDEPEEGDTWLLDDPEVPLQRVPVLERVRRSLLVLGLALVVGAAVTAYPWIAVAGLLLVTWLLRSASLAATATGYRRQLRGARWYDPVIYLVGAPFHLVRSIAGTVLLALWAVGLAVAAALLCYALVLGVESTLLVSGLVLGFALWVGPGGSRVRSPLGRVVRPLARRPVPWLVALVVLLATAGFLGARAESTGVTWTPANSPPFSGVDLTLP